MPFPTVRPAFLFSALTIVACHRSSSAPVEKLDAAVSAVAPAPAPADVGAPPSDAVRTPSGVAMKVLRGGGSSDHPNDDDCVRVRFRGWTREGTLLASSPSEDEGMVQCLRQIVPGLVQALKTMSVGEERRVWVPADLAFAAKDNDRITPKQDLTYDIALLDLMKAPPVPKDSKRLRVRRREHRQASRCKS